MSPDVDASNRQAEVESTLGQVAMTEHHPFRDDHAAEDDLIAEPVTAQRGSRVAFDTLRPSDRLLFECVAKAH